jgi:hypothetical protein
MNTWKYNNDEKRSDFDLFFRRDDSMIPSAAIATDTMKIM